MAETEFERTQKRLAALKAERLPFEAEIRDIADNFAPSRTRLNAANGQDPKNELRRRRHANLVNNKPLIAARTAASGLHAGLTSPARPWCKLGTPSDRDLAEFGPVRTWLDAGEKRMRSVWAKSGLYTALPFCYGEVSMFASMAMVAFENDTNILRFEPYTFGQYWFARDDEGRTDTLYKITLPTVRQLVHRYGDKVVSPRVKQLWDAGNYETKVPVLCTIEPNHDRVAGSPFADGKAFQSVYWELASNRDSKPLRRSGFESNPILSSIWEGTEDECYGATCPGMIALGPARALQKAERDLARANQRAYDPPLQAPASMARSGVSTLPGSTNYLPANEVAGPGIKSLYDFKPDVRGLLDKIDRFERDVDQAFYVDLFLMLSSDERAERATAEEIRAKYEEKVLALGPTLEMFNGRLLTPLVERTFDVLVRRSRPYWENRLDGEPELPPPPKELQDQPLDVDFISVLQQAQRAASLGNIERFATSAITFAKVAPSVLDKVDFDQVMDEIGTELSVPAGLVRDDDAVAEIRASKQQQEQAQQLAAMAPAVKDIAGAAAQVAGTPVPQDNVLSALAGAQAA